jgi:hypothetical protein
MMTPWFLLVMGSTCNRIPLFLVALGMNTLKELDLSRCSKISDAGLRHIVAIQSLEKLRLSGTKLTDNGVMLISSLTNLSFLDLGGIRITDKPLRSLQVQSYGVPLFSFTIRLPVS